MPEQRASEQRPPRRLKRRLWPSRVPVAMGLLLVLSPSMLASMGSSFDGLFRAALHQDAGRVGSLVREIGVTICAAAVLMVAARTMLGVGRTEQAHSNAEIEQVCVPAWFHLAATLLGLVLLSILAVTHVPHAVRLLQSSQIAAEVVWRGVLTRAACATLIFATLVATCEELLLRGEVLRRELAWDRQNKRRASALLHPQT